ncbi:uncharacterized protein VICG_01514 [Vittaforma corneae ATCC 50505]|uniref:Transcription factor IIIC subunit 5 HTH domain-containing protein n=1 Tax=Vittaforma corneae (strain ATCC 50505) TaxID=993615 RepID=L2GL90_VITCO|nr:uncharacterized protein VICG_01514 [Vittaforma corneae ATCC 50505]ELA41409.1 hypothetical protein VICG_01514 [Vittaforma corneae ATCC 50505]
MEHKIEWVLYPFKIHKKDDALLFRLENGFEMRFTRDIFSKRVYSTQVELYRNVIELEITNEKVKIISQIQKINKFETPADFYVPIVQSTREFYESIHSSLINSNLNVLLEKSIEVKKYIREKGFPEIPLPITTTSSHFENFDSAVCKHDNFPRIPIKRVKYGEMIPDSYPEESFQLLKKYLTKEQFELQDSFYRSFFTSTSIARFKAVANQYEKCKLLFKQSISLNMLKRCIGLHAYFTTSGPWRKCWIRFGFDPSLDQNCYQFQLVEMRSKKASFQIFQRPEIIAEVSKNKEWYLLKECDPIDGFISKALKNFIIYTVDNVGVKEIDKKIEEMLDSDFELFEM